VRAGVKKNHKKTQESPKTAPQEPLSRPVEAVALTGSQGPVAAAWLAGLVLVLAWSYWTTFATLAHRWHHEPQYSHGYLVPVFSLILLWFRRDLLDWSVFRPNWLGLPLLLAGVASRLVGAYYYVEWFDDLSIVPTLAGLCLLFGGFAAFRWMWPAIGFLVFMIPLPYRLEVAMAHPLQRIATIASCYSMQTLGMPALSEGNVILLDEIRIGVVEACSGLRMLVIFFALSSAVAVLIDRPIWERCLIVVSAIPIALLSNLIRIVVTGILHRTANSELADWVFHDVAGWLMMPLALGMLWVELWILSRLFVDVPLTTPVPLDLKYERSVANKRLVAEVTVQSANKTPTGSPR
jgi:exosortase